MDIDRPLPLLAGLTPHQFMKRHWQKKPLLVRAAIAPLSVPIGRGRLFELAARDDVESRLILRDGQRWRLRHGPFDRRALPARKTPGWTLLVQGVDGACDAARELLDRFRFVPDARLDDLMISYATDGGGVGPHVDRYDVFLLQAHGQRRWRIGRQKDYALDPDAPLKILSNFQPDQEFLLDAGDMLYLPPGWAHDGVAIGECLTYSIGFRAPEANELARELLLRVADAHPDDPAQGRMYGDRNQPATDAPGAIPSALLAFAQQAIERALRDPQELALALGELMSEPKPTVVFDPSPHEGALNGPLRLDRRTRMLHGQRHVFINGEALRASGRDARTMKLLADQRFLTVAQVATCSDAARACLAEWLAAGWLHRADEENPANEP
ncbi:MAG: cupin domain-containing protein [Burkholderiales bacterium]